MAEALQRTTKDNLPAYLLRRRASPARRLTSWRSAGRRCDHVDVRANGRRCPALPSASAGLGRSRNDPVHRGETRRTRGEAEAAHRRESESSSCKFEKMPHFSNRPASCSSFFWIAASFVPRTTKPEICSKQLGRVEDFAPAFAVLAHKSHNNGLRFTRARRMRVSTDRCTKPMHASRTRPPPVGSPQTRLTTKFRRAHTAVGALHGSGSQTIDSASSNPPKGKTGRNTTSNHGRRRRHFGDATKAGSSPTGRTNSNIRRR